MVNMWSQFDQTEGIEFVSGIFGPQVVTVDGVTFTIEYNDAELDAFDEEAAMLQAIPDNTLLLMGFAEGQMLEHITACEGIEDANGDMVEVLTPGILDYLEPPFVLRVFEALSYATKRQRLCNATMLSAIINIERTKAWARKWRKQTEEGRD